jgi:hypothetical protein
MDNSTFPGAQFMRILAQIISHSLPKDWGFALIVFPFSQPGISNYISSGERETMILALKETVLRLESRQDFNTPEEN